MKKYMLILFVILFTVCGCNKNSKYEKIMKEYAKDYYENYTVKIDGVDEYIVSIEMLERMNEYNSNKYDLSKLDKCKKTSSVNIKVENDNIKEYEFSLNCD